MLKAVIDVETTGFKLGFNEIIQLAIVMFDNDFEPTGLQYVSYIRPNRPNNFHPNAKAANKIDIELINPNLNANVVRAGFLEWKANLFGKEKIFPLGHNFSFDKNFLELFLTADLYSAHFDYHFADSMVLARALQDKGKLKGSKVNLKALAETLGVVNENPHNAYYDALTTLKIYKELMKLL